EELFENFRRLFLARNEHATAGPRQTAQTLLHVHAKRERRKTREMSNLLRGELIKRDGVAEAAATRMRRGGEEAVVRRMPAVHIRMRHAAENGEVIAVLGEHFEIRRERVIGAGRGGEKFLRQQAEVVANTEHPTRHSGLTGSARKGGAHCFEE